MDEFCLSQKEGRFGLSKQQVQAYINEGYTEYVPTRAVEVAAWLGAPRLMIFDCPCAGRAVDSLASHPRILQQKAGAHSTIRTTDTARATASSEPP